MNSKVRERVPGKDHIDPASLNVEAREIPLEPLQTIPQQLDARKQAARSEHLANLTNQMREAIAVVRVATPERDSSQNCRMRYERAYQNMLQAIRQVVGSGGGPVSAPKYLPPPPRTDQEATFSADSFGPDVPADDSHIRARKAAEKAANMRPGAPGTPAHDAWLQFQGAAK